MHWLTTTTRGSGASWVIMMNRLLNPKKQYNYCILGYQLNSSLDIISTMSIRALHTKKNLKYIVLYHFGLLVQGFFLCFAYYKLLIKTYLELFSINSRNCNHLKYTLWVIIWCQTLKLLLLSSCNPFNTVGNQPID